MATIDDVGIPGQPLSNPPLTAWQAAVRDAIKVNQTASAQQVITLTPSASWDHYAGYTQCQLVVQGGFATLVGHIRRSGPDFSMTANTLYKIASWVPAAGTTPVVGSTMAIGLFHNSGILNPVRLVVATNGDVSIQSQTAISVTTGAFAGTNMSFRVS